MRLPESVLDRAPLEDPIFDVPFSGLDEHKPRVPEHVQSLIQKQLFAVECGRMAVDKWIDLAYIEEGALLAYRTRQRQPNGTPKFPLLLKTRVFIEFYWLLHTSRDALAYLRKSDVPPGYVLRDLSAFKQQGIVMYDDYGRLSPMTVLSDSEEETEPELADVPTLLVESKSEPVESGAQPRIISKALPSEGSSQQTDSFSDVEMTDLSVKAEALETALSQLDSPVATTVPIRTRPQRSCTQQRPSPTNPAVGPSPSLIPRFRPQRVCVQTPAPISPTPPKRDPVPSLLLSGTRSRPRRVAEPLPAPAPAPTPEDEKLPNVTTPPRPKRTRVCVETIIEASTVPPTPSPPRKRRRQTAVKAELIDERNTFVLRPAVFEADAALLLDFAGSSGYPEVGMPLVGGSSEALPLLAPEDPLRVPKRSQGRPRGSARGRSSRPPRQQPRHEAVLPPPLADAEQKLQMEMPIIRRRRLSLREMLNDPSEELLAPAAPQAVPVKPEDEQRQPEHELPFIHGTLPKAPLPERPPLWSASRQAMCESVEWFRSFQGGIYWKDNLVKGYFLSGFGAMRDSWEHNGKLIISHGGGKSEAKGSGRTTKNTLKADSDQILDAKVSALMETYRAKQPLVLVIDDNYAPFPYDLKAQGAYMAVLGFYCIKHAWAEYQPSKSNLRGFVVRYKFAFQWCEGQGEPWWHYPPVNPEVAETELVALDVDRTTTSLKASDQPIPIDRATADDPSSAHCLACKTESPRVYTYAWSCLNPACSFFWKYFTTSETWLPLPQRDLVYHPQLLALDPDMARLPPTFRGTLLPPVPNITPEGGVTTTYANSRGWHCIECGQASSRSAWEHFHCSTCDKTYKIEAKIIPARSLMAPRLALSGFTEGNFKLTEYDAIERLPVRYFFHHGDEGADLQLLGNCQTFVPPPGPVRSGKIHLIRSNISALHEADEIFKAYQQQAFAGELLLRRFPLANHKLRGPLLTKYFSQNSGETYRYVGGTDNTVPFDRAPSAVIRARDLIQKRVAEALSEPVFFNEILSAAYMEQQEMNFHTDSEPGLGPVVAGLSMGSPALMHFRLANKLVPSDMTRKISLSVVLRHGDVCVMEGTDVQNCYEHTVVPTNFRIAATARWIEPAQHTGVPLNVRVELESAELIKMEVDECG
ncbi:2OG-FeII-Oxy-2 domain-containing protein [Mycena kentingensis (nom. inval.)]|nr:2OG-FeII-Oxy-2 domain-containing protein [Mycena kentingensis (nom. inval.)]